MYISDKLIFLMELTSTSNKQLAEALNVDPSLISRFRKGTRSIPRKSHYMIYIGEYFANKCVLNNQLGLLSEVIGNYYSFENKNTSQIADIITLWLSSEDIAFHLQSNTIDKLEFSNKDNLYYFPTNNSLYLPNQKADSINAYYGDDGIKFAIRLFAQLVLSSDNADKIYIENDGYTKWLWGDKDYASEISCDITKFINRGSKITRILPPLYNLSMAYDAITRWLPHHTSGQVNTYFYPYLRDNVLHRTLLVAPGTAALFSTSVGIKQESGVTFLTTDLNIIDALEHEFNDFLLLCSPATAIYDKENCPLQIRQSIIDFFEYSSPAVTILSGLSFVTLPPQVFNRLVQRKKRTDLNELRGIYISCRTRFLSCLGNYSYTELFPLASFQEVVTGRVKYVVYEEDDNNDLYYTSEEYRMHLENILYFLENNHNYNVFLVTDDTFNKEIDIYVKKSHRVMLLERKSSLALCNIENPEMITTMWEYANRAADSLRRQNAIDEIRNLISKIDGFLSKNE